MTSHWYSNSRQQDLRRTLTKNMPAAEKTRLQAGLRYDYNKIQTRPDPQSSDPKFQTLNASRLSNAVTASLGAIQR